MGFFSWITLDSKRSIPSTYAEDRPTFAVKMHDNLGNEYLEEDYEGYGIFGGTDFYVLLAEMNDLGPDRGKGIDLAFDEDRPASTLWPQFTEHKLPDNFDFTVEPTSCAHQGYFY